MPLSFRYNGSTQNLHSFGGIYVILCDQCGEEVAQDGTHNIEQAPGGVGEASPLHFYHYECSLLAQQQRPETTCKMYWRKLASLHVRTQ